MNEEPQSQSESHPQPPQPGAGYDPEPQAFPVFAFAVAAVAAAVGAAGTWALTVHVWGDQLVPILLPGLLVGLGVRFVAGGVKMPWAWGMIGIALVGSFAGFLWADTQVWTPFILEQTLRRAASIMGLLAFAASCYLAFRLSLK